MIRTYRNRRRNNYFKVQVYDEIDLVWKDFNRKGFDDQSEAESFLREHAGNDQYRIVEFTPEGCSCVALWSK